MGGSVICACANAQTGMSFSQHTVLGVCSIKLQKIIGGIQSLCITKPDLGVLGLGFVGLVLES